MNRFINCLMLINWAQIRIEKYWTRGHHKNKFKSLKMSFKFRRFLWEINSSHQTMEKDKRRVFGHRSLEKILN